MRARISAIRYKMEVTIKCSQQETNAAINSIWAELEEAIKHRVQDVLARVDQRTQGISRYLTRRLIKCRWTYGQ
jgi:hypothetical protein